MTVNEKKTSTIDEQIINDLSESDEGYNNLITLCDIIGCRFAGTPGERRAADYIHAKFKEYCLTAVSTESVHFKRWLSGDASLKVISPIERIFLNVAAFGCSASTSPEGIKGEIISVADGFEEDYESRVGAIKDRIALATAKFGIGQRRNPITKQDKYRMAESNGAKAFILMNDLPGQLVPLGGAEVVDDGTIPGVCISKEDGEFLRRLACRGPVEIDLHVETRVAENTSLNIVGEIEGSDPGRLIILGAHYDGWDIGALNNAVGTCVMMEVARVLARYAGQPRCNIRFVAFAAEVLGLEGSRSYVKKHNDELARIELMLNVDGGPGRPGRKSYDGAGFEGLVQYVNNVAKEINADFNATDDLGFWNADKLPFFLRGIPCTTINGPRSPYVHTTADTVDKIDLADMRRDAADIARLVLRVANEEGPVNRHLTNDEVTIVLESEGLTEAIRRTYGRDLRMTESQ